jgi:acetyl esterase
VASRGAGWQYRGMSSMTGLKRADGQRVTLAMAALTGPSTVTLNLASRWPKPLVRRALDAVFPLYSSPHRRDAEMRELTLDVPEGPAVPARLYEPAGVGPGAGLLVFMHGGGFILGSLVTHANLCRFTARTAGCKVLAIGYRKAPEHPFPAALEDSVAAFRWAVKHAGELGVDPARIAVGGDSAGGNLAAGIALGLDPGEPGPCFAWLVYPLVDPDITAYPSARLFARGPLLTRANLLDMIGHYAPDPATRHDPRLSLVDAGNLERMPPTYLATAGMDPIRDQGERFAEQLREAGVAVQCDRFANMPHGFDLLLVDPDARRATAATCAALARGLAPRER